MWINRQQGNVFAVLLIDLHCLILSCFSVNVKEQLFTKQNNLVVRVSVLSIIKQSAHSKLECAALCLQKEDCVNFSYNTSTQACYTSTRLMPNGDTVFYNHEYFCPGDKGYILWIFPDMEFCLNYNSKTKTNEDAKEHCGKDGGHLMLIESDAMRLNVKAALHEMNVTGSVHMDGSKLPNNSIIAWNGKLFTSLMWDSRNPGDANENCLHGEPQGFFLARANKCGNPDRAFVCQIDI